MKKTLNLSEIRNYDDAIAEKNDRLKQMEGLINARKKDSRDFTEDESKRYNTLVDEVKSLNVHADSLLSEERRLYKGLDKRTVSGDQWINRETGNPVNVLQRDHKLADNLPDGSPRDLSLGKYIRGMITGNWTGAEAEQRSAPMSTVGASATVPEALFASIVDNARAQSVVSRANGVQMVTFDTKKLNIARFNSDPVFETKAENEAFTDRFVDVDSIDLNGWTIGTIVPISQELSQDSPNFASALDAAISRALAAKLDQLYLFGAGSTEIKGITNVTGVQEVAAGGNLTYSHLINAWTKITSENFNPGNLFFNPRDLASLTEAEKTSLGYTARPELLANINFGHSSAFVTNLGTGTDESMAVMGDFSNLMLGLRQSAQLEISREAGDAFKKHQLLIKLTFRGDAVPLRPKAFCKITGLVEYTPT
jgi:HK97 family phage major capsid protein